MPHPPQLLKTMANADSSAVPAPASEPARSAEARDLDSLRKEAGEAFKLGRKGRKNQDLSWLGLQCTGGGWGAGNSRGVGEFYPLYSGDRSKLTFLDKQTYRMWKSAMGFERFRHPIRQRRRTILIQPITHVHGSGSTLHSNDHHHHGNDCHLHGNNDSFHDNNDSFHGNDNHLYDNGPTCDGAVGEEEEQFYKHTHIDGNVLELLRQFCSAYFSEMRVKVAPPLDLSEIPRLTSRIHQRTHRRQFLVDDIIDFLSSEKLRKAYCILGVTTVDLYPGPEWNFVLGQASVYKGSGVFSFGRYFHSVVSKETRGRGSGMERKEIEEEQIRNLWILMRVRDHRLI